MTCRAAGILCSILLIGGCGTDGAEKYGGGPPPVEETYGWCAFCHEERATGMMLTGGHGSLDVKCQFCHPDLTPGEVGPDHRGIPACADCHTEQETHPQAGTPNPCQVCHTPHGSPNLSLIQDEVVIPSGATRPIDFTNREGRADGSFASASHPGTGICEICHTTTLFYRSDGEGESHFTFTCTVCHPHSTGFAFP